MLHLQYSSNNIPEVSQITRKIMRRWRKVFYTGPAPKITSKAYQKLRIILDIWGINTFKCTLEELFIIIIPQVNVVEQFTIQKIDVDQAFSQAFVT
jgi:hypothetical protein